MERQKTGTAKNCTPRKQPMLAEFTLSEAEGRTRGLHIPAPENLGQRLPCRGEAFVLNIRVASKQHP